MKQLVPWSSISPATLRGRFDRLVDHFFADPFGDGILPQVLGVGRDVACVPSVEIEEDDDRVLVRAELPGIEAKDVDLELHDGVLSISGKREDRHEERTQGGGRVSEFRYGAFRREVALPAPVDGDSVSARCENGVLTVEMRKVESARARRIKVQAR